MKNKTNKITKLDSRYMFLSVMFISFMLISNLLAVKLIQVGPWTMTPGIFIYPFSFMFGDVLTELYGFKETKKVIWTGFLVQISLVVFSTLAVNAAYPVFWEGQQAMEFVFGTTLQIVTGSLVAFLAGGMSNAWVMEKMKTMFKGKHLWLRAISSTLVGEVLDSIFFVTIAFWGRMPMNEIMNLIVVQSVVKTLTEAIAGTPLTYLFISKWGANNGKE